MNPLEKAFLATIADDPFDAVTRLAYSDWLEEENRHDEAWSQREIAKDQQTRDGEEEFPEFPECACAPCDEDEVRVYAYHGEACLESKCDENPDDICRGFAHLLWHFFQTRFG